MRTLIAIILIFSFTALKSQTLQPTKTEALLKVYVTNSKEEPRGSEIVILEGKTDKKQYTGVTNNEGKCEFLIPKGQSYDVKYQIFDKIIDYNAVMEIPQFDGMLTQELRLVYSEMSKVYRLDNVLFETAKADIKPESYPNLDNLAEYLLIKKSMVIEIGGHTDNVGNADYNLNLSQKRSESVRNYLIKKGVNPNNLIAKGYGMTQPVSDNSSEAGRKLNRRTEIKILK